MQHLLIIVMQLIALYWLSGQVHRYAQLLFYSWLKTPHRMVWAMNILFLPGVFIHELAHWLVARLLWVKAGRISLIPKIQPDGFIEMGSVRLPKQLDVFRFALIGLAPVYIGLAIIWGLMWSGEAWQLWSHWWWWPVVGYGMFEVGNTFFASRSDMAWALRFSIIVGVICGIAYWAGWRPTLEWLSPWLEQYEQVLSQAGRWLWVPIMIDGIIILILRKIVIR